jgi:hypothetical protein
MDGEVDKKAWVGWRWSLYLMCEREGMMVAIPAAIIKYSKKGYIRSQYKIHQPHYDTNC